MAGIDSDTVLQTMDIESLRKQNIADNQRILKEIMADIQKLPHLQPRPAKRPRLQKPRRDVPSSGDEPARRNPSRAARVSSWLEMSPPRTRSRSSSISSSSSTLSSPNRMVVKFGFCRRDGAVEAEDSDMEEELMPSRARAATARDVRSAEDITEDDLLMVATTVRDKAYDSIYGSSCHQCRQKTNDLKTICRSGRCYGVRGQFCGPCLRNRYGEDAKAALKDPEWECPPCRSICNCSFCRKKQGKSCTGILIHLAREAGYSNVNDYLQSLKRKIAGEED